jgi:hypothetical protein
MVGVNHGALLSRVELPAGEIRAAGVKPFASTAARTTTAKPPVLQQKAVEPSRRLPVALAVRGKRGVAIADADRLQTLAYARVQAAHDVEDTDTAAMLLESARRFLERSKPEVAALGTDVRAFDRRFEH